MSDTEDSPEPLPNLPAPTSRYDGWTADRQTDFLTALATCGCVRDASKAVGMSNVSAYPPSRAAQRHRLPRAWDAALDSAMQRLEEAALSRAINGVARPIFYRGEQVGEWRDHDERLAMFLLRYRRGHRYGSHLHRLVPPAPPEPPPGCENDGPDPDEAMGLLDWYLELTDYRDPPYLANRSSRAMDGANFANFDPDCEGGGSPVEPRE